MCLAQCCSHVASICLVNVNFDSSLVDLNSALAHNKIANVQRLTVSMQAAQLLRNCWSWRLETSHIVSALTCLVLFKSSRLLHCMFGQTVSTTCHIIMSLKWPQDCQSNLFSWSSFHPVLHCALRRNKGAGERSGWSWENRQKTVLWLNLKVLFMEKETCEKCFESV